MSADEEVIDLVPYEQEDSVDEARPLHRLIRATLVTLTVPWIIVFCVAVWIDPYAGGEVQRAGTQLRYTGSWLSVFTTADPEGSESLPEDGLVELTTLLDRYRLAEVLQ